LIPIDQGLIVTGGAASFLFCLSIFSLFFTPDRVLRSIMFTYAGGYFLALVALNRWDHMSIPFHYLVCCCPAFFIGRVHAYVSTRLPRGSLALLAIPLAMTLWVDVEGFMTDGVNEFPLDAFKDLNSYVNANTKDGDLVVAYTYSAPELKADTLLLIEVMAYHGNRIAYLNREYAPSDFAYNHSLDNIEYMVLPEGPIGKPDYPTYGSLTSELEGWPVAYRLDILWRRRPGFGSAVLEYLGSPAVDEAHYVVLENPRRVEKG